MDTLPQDYSALRSWTAFFGAMLCCITIAFTSSGIMDMAVAMRHDLNMSIAELNWMIIGYTIVGTSTILLFAQIGDAIGHLKIYIIGTLCFMAGSIVLAVAVNGWMAILGRLIQGLAVGTALPSSMAIIKICFPDEKQILPLNLWAGIISLFFGIGPIVSGVFTEYVTWRLSFWVLVPVDALGLIFIFAAQPIIKRVINHAVERHFPDIIGWILFTVTLATLLIIFNEGPLEWGWSSPVMIALYAVCPGAFILLIISQIFIKRSIFPKKALRHRNVIAGCIGIFAVLFTLYPLMYLFNLYAQQAVTLNMSAFIAGIALLPLTGALFVISIFDFLLVKWFGYKWLIVTGLVLILIGDLFFFWLPINADYGHMWWPLLICGIGLGFTFPLFSPLALSRVPNEEAGQVSGLIQTFMFLGATVGIIFTNFWYAARIKDVLNDFATKAHLTPAHIDRLFDMAFSNESHFREHIHHFSRSMHTTIQNVQHYALTSGLHFAMLLAAAVIAVSILTTLILAVNPKSHEKPNIAKSRIGQR